MNAAALGDGCGVENGALTSSDRGDEGVACSVCYSVPNDVDTAMVPDCSHSFCASCLVGWSRLKQVCPLCKSEFSSLLVRRDVNGNEVRFGTELGWAEVSVSVLQQATWMDLVELRSAREDILSSFSFGPVSSELEAARLEHARRLRVTVIGGAPGMVAPVVHRRECGEDEEDSEDDDYDAMWYEEQEFWEKGASRASASSGRRNKVVLGNRPRGASGFMREGRANARPLASSSSASVSSPSSQNSNPSKSSSGRRRRSKGLGPREPA